MKGPGALKGSVGLGGEGTLFSHVYRLGWPRSTCALSLGGWFYTEENITEKEEEKEQIFLQQPPRAVG